jgi:hypothetical protein
MYIDEYNITVIGSKYNREKDKHEKNVEKVKMHSVDGIQLREFANLLRDVNETHGCSDIVINVELKQHQYD